MGSAFDAAMPDRPHAESNLVAVPSVLVAVPDRWPVAARKTPTARPRTSVAAKMTHVVSDGRTLGVEGRPGVHERTHEAATSSIVAKIGFRRCCPF